MQSSLDGAVDAESIRNKHCFCLADSCSSGFQVHERIVCNPDIDCYRITHRRACGQCHLLLSGTARAVRCRLLPWESHAWGEHNQLEFSGRGQNTALPLWWTRGNGHKDELPRGLLCTGKTTDFLRGFSGVIHPEQRIELERPPARNLQRIDRRQPDRVSNFPNFSIRTITVGGMRRSWQQNSNQIRRNNYVCPYFSPNSAALSTARDIIRLIVLDGPKSAEVGSQRGRVRW